MNRNATVPVGELEKALDFLGGLVQIVEAMKEGRDPRELVDELQEDYGFAAAWEPLRYESPDARGMGWGFIAANASGCRDALVEAYGNAAL